MHGFCEMGACQKWASWDLRLLTVLVGGSLHAKLVQVTRLKTPILLLLFMAPVACGLPPNVAHALDTAIGGQVAYANGWAHPHANLFCLCVGVAGRGTDEVTRPFPCFRSLGKGGV